MKKNVLFILVDDLRPEINCFGKHKLVTPNIDKLAEQSIMFENTYCQTPLCTASRASFFTGLLNKGKDFYLLKDIRKNNEITMPGYFKENGYETVSIGKSYHFNHEDDESWTRRYSHTFYDEKNVCDGYCSGFQLQENKDVISNMARNFSGEKGLKLPPMTECADVDEAEYPDFKTVSYAINELSKFKLNNHPFFMTVGLYRPHLPWAVPKKYWDLYERENVELAANDFFPKNGVGRTDLSDFLHYGDEIVNETYKDIGIYDENSFPILDKDKQREFIHGYWSSVSFMDAQVGRLMDALKAMDMEKDTIIVFAADNGWQLGEHRLWSKVAMFEESTRVPMLMCINDVTKGTKTHSLSQLLDIYPTLCDFCDLPLPKHLEGKSLKPLIVNNEEVNEAVFTRMTDGYTARYKNYRFTYYAQASGKADKWHLKSKYNCELFDLSNDKAENVNIFPEYAQTELVNKFKTLIEEKYDININLKF